MRFLARSEARLLPSRHNFALFRLAAFVRLSLAEPTKAPEHPDRLWFVDRNQSTPETYAVAAWVTATSALYLAAVLQQRLGLLLAALLAFPAAALLLEVPTYVVGLILVPAWNAATGRRARDNNGVISAATLLVVIVASAHFARVPAWPRFVAWQFLASCALNACASLALFALRSRIRRLEESVGGPPSAA